ncbi:MAG TPA: MFS transporter [Anaerolineales bacterium]|nr:MFS transporter [Anaerolineales bacterium]
MFSNISRFFKQSDIPPEYHATFRHLYFDIAWFGVLSGSAVNFLSIYATRLGATSLQIGLIGAMSAIVNLFLAIPAGRWLAKRNINRAIFWTSVFYRLGFLAFIFLPWLFDEPTQIIAIIVITFLMAIPLTPLGVGFNALFAEAVPEQYRAHVAGIRNVMLAITFITTSLISGNILEHTPFPTGYQIVFGIGAFGAAMSSFHLYFVKPLKPDAPAPQTTPAPDSVKPTASFIQNLFSALRLDILTSPFRRVLLALFAFHLTHNITTPVYPQYNVRVLHLNDDHLGTGTAFYYLTMLLGSFPLKRIVHRLGNQKVTALGMMGMATYPLLLSFATEVWHYYLISLLGGFTWAWANGAYANYMLERTPAHDRPAHLAWYTLILNSAILAGALGGSALATQIGLSGALLLFALLRFLAGLFILKWG